MPTLSQPVDEAVLNNYNAPRRMMTSTHHSKMGNGTGEVWSTASTGTLIPSDEDDIMILDQRGPSLPTTTVPLYKFYLPTQENQKQPKKKKLPSGQKPNLLTPQHPVSDILSNNTEQTVIPPPPRWQHLQWYKKQIYQQQHLQQCDFQNLSGQHYYQNKHYYYQYYQQQRAIQYYHQKQQQDQQATQQQYPKQIHQQQHEQQQLEHQEQKKQQKHLKQNQWQQHQQEHHHKHQKQQTQHHEQQQYYHDKQHHHHHHHQYHTYQHEQQQLQEQNEQHHTYQHEQQQLQQQNEQQQQQNQHEQHLQKHHTQQQLHHEQQKHYYHHQQQQLQHYEQQQQQHHYYEQEKQQELHHHQQEYHHYYHQQHHHLLDQQQYRQQQYEQQKQQNHNQQQEQHHYQEHQQKHTQESQEKLHQQQNQVTSTTSHLAQCMPRTLANINHTNSENHFPNNNINNEHPTSCQNKISLNNVYSAMEYYDDNMYDVTGGSKGSAIQNCLHNKTLVKHKTPQTLYCYTCSKTVCRGELVNHLFFGKLECYHCHKTISNCVEFQKSKISPGTCLSNSSNVHKFTKWCCSAESYLSKFLVKELAIDGCYGSVVGPPTQINIKLATDEYINKLTCLSHMFPWKSAFCHYQKSEHTPKITNHDMTLAWKRRRKEYMKKRCAVLNMSEDNRTDQENENILQMVINENSENHFDNGEIIKWGKVQLPENIDKESSKENNLTWQVSCVGNQTTLTRNENEHNAFKKTSAPSSENDTCPVYTPSNHIIAKNSISTPISYNEVSQSISHKVSQSKTNFKTTLGQPDTITLHGVDESSVVLVHDSSGTTTIPSEVTFHSEASQLPSSNLYRTDFNLLSSLTVPIQFNFETAQLVQNQKNLKDIDATMKEPEKTCTISEKPGDENLSKSDYLDILMEACKQSGIGYEFALGFSSPVKHKVVQDQSGCLSVVQTEESNSSPATTSLECKSISISISEEKSAHRRQHVALAMEGQTKTSTIYKDQNITVTSSEIKNSTNTSSEAHNIMATSLKRQYFGDSKSRSENLTLNTWEQNTNLSKSENQTISDAQNEEDTGSRTAYTTVTISDSHNVTHKSAVNQSSYTSNPICENMTMDCCIVKEDLSDNVERSPATVCVNSRATEVSNENVISRIKHAVIANDKTVYAKMVPFTKGQCDKQEQIQKLVKELNVSLSHAIRKIKDERYLVVHFPDEVFPQQCPECYCPLSPSMMTVNEDSLLISSDCPDCRLPIYILPDEATMQSCI